jgi:rubrerythrin
MITKTRKDLLTAMHTEAFGYAEHMLFAKLARANGHPELSDLCEEIANADYLEAFAREAKLLGLVGTDIENIEAITRGARTQHVRKALRTALAEIRNKVGAGEAGPVAPEHPSLPEPDEGEIC